MEQHKIDRINELAKKHKTVGLTEEEHAERKALHREYVDSVLGSLKGHLDNTYLGSTRDIHQMTIAPTRGVHTITVVDSSGAMQHIEIIII